MRLVMCCVICSVSLFVFLSEFVLLCLVAPSLLCVFVVFLILRLPVSTLVFCVRILLTFSDTPSCLLGVFVCLCGWRLVLSCALFFLWLLVGFLLSCFFARCLPVVLLRVQCYLVVFFLILRRPPRSAFYPDAMLLRPAAAPLGLLAYLVFRLLLGCHPSESIV